MNLPPELRELLAVVCDPTEPDGERLRAAAVAWPLANELVAGGPHPLARWIPQLAMLALAARKPAMRRGGVPFWYQEPLADLALALDVWSARPRSFS